MIRAATPADVERLEAVENAADERFLQRFEPAEWPPAESGAARVSIPGFVLVVAAEADGPAIGFAHVVEVGGAAHLEQLSVLPVHGGRGHGRTLVHAALAEAAARGHLRVTLRTFADVPWNAPFYRSCGFVESEPDTDLLLGLVGVEQRLGLPAFGRRVQMTAHLAPPDRLRSPR